MAQEKRFYSLLTILLKSPLLNGQINLIQILFIPLNLMDFALAQGLKLLLFYLFFRKEYGLYVDADLERGYSKPSETFANNQLSKK